MFIFFLPVYRSRGPGSVPGAPLAGPPADPAAGDAQEEQRFPAACSDGPCGSRYFASIAQPGTKRYDNTFICGYPLSIINVVCSILVHCISMTPRLECILISRSIAVVSSGV